MTTKRHKTKIAGDNCVVRARVDSALKRRVTNYRTRPEVKRSEGFIVRQAVEAFLDTHAPEKTEVTV